MFDRLLHYVGRGVRLYYLFGESDVLSRSLEKSQLGDGGLAVILEDEP